MKAEVVIMEQLMVAQQFLLIGSGILIKLIPLMELTTILIWVTGLHTINFLCLSGLTNMHYPVTILTLSIITIPVTRIG